jgi:LacI family transcriptional regulator
MAALLDADSRPTVIIAGSDLLAAALQAINDRGLRFPDHLSLIGYDDAVTETLTPPLTSIAQPVAELGRGAVALALNAMRDVKGAPHSTNFPTRLAIRASTARPRNTRRP